ncbi:hypothetical protein [Variovorax sp. HJSM1_2]|uniref:hypothetical protein n=1 Tax=Variovorax sp. HJSM1_2 TaxID=3366263 RepID=UPI003BDD00DE
MLLLARGQVMDFELQRGFHFSALAAQLFSAQGNPVGLVEALSVVNYTASSLGLPDARQGREDLLALLEDGAAGHAVHALGLNYLGVSAFWENDFQASAHALESAVMLSQVSHGGPAMLQPLVNASFLEVLSLSKLVRQHQDWGDGAKLVKLVAAAQTASNQWYSQLPERRTALIGTVLLLFVSCIAAIRDGKLVDACRHHQACLEIVNQLPRHCWLRAITWWARAELAASHDDCRQAVVAAGAMRIAARVGQHQRLEVVAGEMELHYRTSSRLRGAGEVL